MSESYEKRGYLLEDFRLFHLRGAGGIQTEYHYHEFCKLLLLISGSGGYSVEGQRYSLQSGDAVLIGSRCVHRPEFELNTPYERIILYISPDFLRKASTEDCDLLECFSGKWGHVLRPPQGSARRLLSLASALERELSGDSYGRVILSNGLLLRLLVEIGRDLNRSDALLPAPIQPQNDRILEVLRYIDDHLAEDISIDDLAERVYLSKYHMMRLFRGETGSSIHGYITQRRLMLARDLMAGGMSATESCFRSGFRSYSAFTRTYGRHFGTTPTGRARLDSRTEETFE